MRALLALALLWPLLVLGQYPAKPLRMVIPFPPGGATDIIGRVVAQKMGERLGQSVVVDNRPGAGGTIGSELVAKSAPDGYTILVSTNSTHAVAAVLSKPPYDPLRDFTPIALLADSPNILVISPRLGIASVKELIAAAKAKPGTLSFASSGNGTIIHLTGEMFKQMAGVDLLHVPYKGTALSIPDLANGRVSILFDNIVSAQPHLRAGTVKALAVTSKARSALMPDLPTMSEAGVPGFDSTAWFALFGPAGLPAEIRTRLHEAAVAAVKAADARERLAAAGAEISGAGGDELASLIRGDIAKWGRVVKTGNIKAE
jgi:tripartite-type tricarboxylate transporter receptor subunit TctC